MRIQGGLAAVSATIAMLVPATAQAGSLHFARFTVTDRHAVTKRLTPAKDLWLVSVRVNGDQLVFGDQVSDNVALMYGAGVALRFTSKGTRQTVRAASVLRSARVTITYRVTLPAR